MNPRDVNKSNLSLLQPIELSPMGKSKNAGENDEDDIIIGRFRKISSAKSMAITNGNSKNDIPAESFPKMSQDEQEAGLQFRKLDDGDSAKLLIDVGKPTIVPASNTKVTKKTSFRDTEKPSRFKDNQNATRFQMAAHEDLDVDSAVQTEDEEEAASCEESDDPLTPDCDTKYARSFRHRTREALPRLDNYRNMLSLHAAPRPTLDELHNASLSPKPGQGTMEKDAESGDGTKATGMKFGWIQGVLVRCLLNIWGVMLFLRLSWVVAQAGVAQSMVLILTTSVVTSITALSMSAISTNGVIKGGGTYYMISRSLGPEFGGSIGLIFSMANAVACAMYVVGFCESLTDMLDAYFGITIFDGGVQDTRIVGSITILMLTVIVVVGMEWEAKAQIALLVILLVAIGDFLIGSFIGPKSKIEIAKGFLGYNTTLLRENMYSNYRPYEGTEQNFFSVFAIFFPAATGILAGANISGDLKDPQHSIPKGTLLAIFLTTGSYLLMALLSGWSVARDATGNDLDTNFTFLTKCITDNVTSNVTTDVIHDAIANITTNVTNDVITNITSNATAKVKCAYGLHNTFQVIELVSAFGPLIYAGCFAATLSSALASLVSAPKVFQALCKDKLYPGLEWFARGYGKNNEPVRGYILTFFIALAFILVGKLNSIAPLISNFFLAAYTLINFSTFHASLAKPVGWRPTFRWYNMWLSLFGAVLCVAVMFLISWSTALLTFAAVLALYLIVAYRKPDVNWGSTTQAQIYKNALSGVQQLNRVTDHVKNYRPQVLVLTGFPGSRPALADFTFLLTKGLSLMLCGHIVQSKINNKTRNALSSAAYQWLNKRKLKAFYSLVDDVPFRQGANALIQAAGIGKLKPNILLMGFKSDWNKCPIEELSEYIDIMHKALDMHMALCVLRMEGGLQAEGVGAGSRGAAGAHDDDGSLLEALQDIQNKEGSSLITAYRESNESLLVNGTTLASQASSVCDISTVGAGTGAVGGKVSCDPAAGMEEGQRPSAGATEAEAEAEKKQPLISKPAAESVVYVSAATAGRPRRASSLSQTLSHFARKQSGTIDVWWLYDDGGLTLLLPYIISTRRNWSSCRLRVFTLANKKAEMEFEERSMASLLSKFRIDYSDLKIIPDVTKKPQDATLAYFDRLIARFRVPDNPDDPDSAPITEEDLLAAADRTNRHLRLRELIREHSCSARLLAVTLPMPRRQAVTPPALYQAWLEAIAGSGDGPPMPPCLLVRGNQTSVLTFYS